MKADRRFEQQPPRFWATVKLVSERFGYSGRDETGQSLVHAPETDDIREALIEEGLDADTVMAAPVNGGSMEELLKAYYEYRAEVLNNSVRTQLMDAKRARREFERLHGAMTARCALPMNKQKKEKRKYAYLTCIVNLLIDANIDDLPCDYSPGRLITVTDGKVPVRTLSRRFDGAFPSVVNPIAIWEFKEYYYTTTFGSRIADGVYETLLDGLELRELHQIEERKIGHILVIDAYDTWWKMGKSYLCRIVDMLHMGYVDEVLVGAEVLERVPAMVREWRKQFVDESRNVEEERTRLEASKRGKKKKKKTKKTKCR